MPTTVVRRRPQQLYLPPAEELERRLEMLFPQLSADSVISTQESLDSALTGGERSLFLYLPEGAAVRVKYSSESDRPLHLQSFGPGTLYLSGNAVVHSWFDALCHAYDGASIISHGRSTAYGHDRALIVAYDRSLCRLDAASAYCYAFEEGRVDIEAGAALTGDQVTARVRGPESLLLAGGRTTIGHGSFAARIVLAPTAPVLLGEIDESVRLYRPSQQLWQRLATASPDRLGELLPAG